VPATKLTPEEIAARGEAIYDRDIRHKVEGTHDGKFLVLDIETGEYEIDASCTGFASATPPRTDWAGSSECESHDDRDRHCRSGDRTGA
jgi:hypothetical protein